MFIMNEINKIGSGGFMNPDKIVEELNMRSGMIVADFGCGSGYFTIPIAKIIKNSGKIYAIDVLNEALENVLSKAKLYDLLNIKTVRANIETVGGSKIKDGSVDLAILANVLFQCNDHNSVLIEAKRILKSDGKIVIIDWIPKEVPLGPKYEHCLNEEDIKKLSIKNGLKVTKKIDAGSQHYGMVLKAF
jgi:ubiquinone/menaquinone biosynthesis C-methylase UbiE